MRQNKTISVILLIVMLGLLSLNIPMIAMAYLGNKAEKTQVQVLSVQEDAKEQPAVIDNIDNTNAVPATAVSRTVVRSTYAGYDQAPAPSRSSVSRHNLDSLARLVYGEARGESFTGQVAIAAVVLNRVESEKFGSTVDEVIFEPGAFTAVCDGQYYLKPDDSAYKAVEAALNGWDPTNKAIYYWNPTTATNKWIWSRTITITIGKHVFAH